MIARVLKRYNKFIKYSLIGVTSASLDFLVFYLLNTYTSINYLIINVISISCGITNSFFLNAKLNFKVHDRYLKRYLKFYTVGILGIIVSNVTLYILHGQMELPVMLSKIATVLLVVVIQFSLNSKYSLASSNV